jgi:phosphomannomutase
MWNTVDIVKAYGGTPVLCKSGYAFIKAKMREVDGIYGGELVYRVPDSKAVIAAVRARYEPQSTGVDLTDGLSIDLPDWRLNLRSSNTEPLIRLNLESRANSARLREKTEEIVTLLHAHGAVAADH